MTCDLKSFSTVFQSYMYQGAVTVIIKGCVQWNVVHGWKDVRLMWGSNTVPLDQKARKLVKTAFFDLKYQSWKYRELAGPHLC